MTDADRDARIAALETLVANMQGELARLRRPRIRSMRSTGRCPSCDGRRLLHFNRIKDVAHGSALDLSLQKDYSAWWGVKLTAGVLEAYACKACKLVEWSAVSLDDVQADGKDVLEIVGPEDTDPETGPYR